MSITEDIKKFAREQGADLIGIAPAHLSNQELEHLKNFIQKGRQGNMKYLENAELRVTPQQLLPGAQSVIVIAVNYYREVPQTPKGHGRIARYAYGRDYHKVLKKILKQMAAYIESRLPNERTYACVDSSPLLEKAFAVKAGLGFIGKNTTLITKKFGSFVLLAEIITTAKLDYDSEEAGTCGTCTRCISACPTKAIVAPQELDARRCISYLTIENKEEIPQEFHKPIGNIIFGCDICQEVCPYNQAFAKPLTLQAFKEVTIAGSSLDLQEILAIDSDEQYLQKFAGSPLMRPKRKNLQRNAAIALKNSN